MRLFLDIDSREFLQSPSFPRALTTLALKRRDTDLIELQFIRDRVVQELPAGTVARLGLKPDAAYTAEFLATGTFTKSGTGTATRYLLDLNLNTVSLNAAFAAATPEPETLAAMLEVEWTSGSNISSSLTLPVTIANDVIRGDEGEPVDLPIFYAVENNDFRATQAEAEAGTNNDKWMSPLRTAQAIAALAGEGGGLPSQNPTVTGQLTVNSGDSLFITGQRVTSEFASFIDFEEGRFHYNGRDILNWGAYPDTLFINARLTIDSGDQVSIGGDQIWSGFGPTVLQFEEGRLEFSGNDVLYWGTAGQLTIGNRTLKDLGAPVDANDAVRKVELDSKAALSHTHPLSALTQSSAATGQVATWNGTAWVPQTPASGSGGVSSWNDLTDKPSTFPPSTHTHAAADITSGILGIARIPTGTTGTSVCIGNDSRLFDARTPTSHTHAATDINSGILSNARTSASSSNTANTIVARDGSGNFSAGTITANLTGNVTGIASGNAPANEISPTAISGTAVVTTDSRLSDARPPTSHTHSASDITSGSLDISRIPTGMTSTSVCIGNDTRLSNARPPTSHTHSASDITSGSLDISRIPTGTTSTSVCIGNDERLSNARPPTSHTHGNITNAGAIGTASGAPIITGTNGVLQAGSFGTTAGTFAAGNHTHSDYVTTSGGITAIAVVSVMPGTPNPNTLYIVS